MEQYGTDKLFMMSKVMDTFENFIMETTVIFYMLSLEVIKNDIKNYIKDNNAYLGLDNQARSMIGHYTTRDIWSTGLIGCGHNKKTYSYCLVKVGDKVYILGVKRKVLDGKYDVKVN
eukprot:15506_1